MSVTQAYDLTRFMDTLDCVLLGLRDRSDELDPRSGTSLVDSIRLGCLGIGSSTFTSGVIFGLDLCQVQNIASQSYGMMPGMVSGMGGGLDPNAWIVTRGALFDGTQVRNIEPTDGTEYVYALSLPSGLEGANFIAIGAIVYETSTGAFMTKMLGQSGSVVRTMEKTNVSVQDILEAALGENPKDDDLRVQPTATQILIGRFVLDAELIDGDTSDYEIFGSSSRDRYPLPSGIPYRAYAELAVEIDTAMGITAEASFDTTMAFNVLTPVVNAAVWGTSFYDYWTTPGRVLQTNVKYYYNQIWTPPIP